MAYLRSFSGQTPQDYAVTDAEWGALSPADQRQYMRLCENGAFELRALLEQIPPCPVHGDQCLPHAREWLAAQRTTEAPSSGGLRALARKYTDAVQRTESVSNRYQPKLTDGVDALVQQCTAAAELIAALTAQAELLASAGGDAS